MSIKLKNIVKELLKEEQKQQLLVEQAKLYFDCTENYKGVEDDYYCIKYGPKYNCGRYKMHPSYSKEWQGINIFDEGTFTRGKGNTTSPKKPVKGKVGVILEIFEKNSYFELYFEWLDTEWGRVIARLIYGGKFKCGDNNNLLFYDIKLDIVDVMDMSDHSTWEDESQEPGVVEGKGKALVKSFFNKILAQTQNLKLNNPKNLSGDEMMNDINAIMAD